MSPGYTAISPRTARGSRSLNGAGASAHAEDRAEVLRALLVANGGKMLATDARRKMHLRKELFSPLLKKCDFVEVKPLHSDGRKKVIILKG